MYANFNWYCKNVRKKLLICNGGEQDVLYVWPVETNSEESAMRSPTAINLIVIVLMFCYIREIVLIQFSSAVL